MITEEQRRERLNYLGSSDVAAILGMSRYATPISVWAEKTGTLPPEDISSKLQIKVGNKMEAVVAELFMEETGKTVHRVNETIYHKEHPFIACNLDRRVIGERAILEIKTASAYRLKEFDQEELPAETMVQVYHQLMVTGWPKAYLCILVGNTDLIIREIPADPQVQADLLKKEVSFWTDFVAPRVMPTMVTRYDAEVIGSLFPTADEVKEIALGDEINKQIEFLEGLKRDCRHLEGLIDKTENEIKIAMGDAAIGSTGLYTVWWKNSQTTRLDMNRFKSEAPNLYAQYCVSKPGRRFAYKKIKNNGE